MDIKCLVDTWDIIGTQEKVVVVGYEVQQSIHRHTNYCIGLRPGDTLKKIKYKGDSTCLSGKD